MKMFLDGGPWEAFTRRLYYRFCKLPRYWHNRAFSRSQTIERAGDGGWLVRWPGRGEIVVRPIDELPRKDPVACVVASGPSIRRIERPEMIFRAPAACVNGAASLAQKLGLRIPYYFVSDSHFVVQQPQLFAAGVERADAVVLNPKTLFAALARSPGLLVGRRVYLCEDLRRPFKRPQPSMGRMRRGPQLLAHPNRKMAFSLCPGAGVYPGGTVVYVAVQVLFGIGCEKLFVFGMDLNSGGRFYREGDPSPSNLDRCYFTNILPAFELARAYCEQTGKTLLNCSPKSRLPSAVIPQMDGNQALRMIADELASRSAA